MILFQNYIFFFRTEEYNPPRIPCSTVLLVCAGRFCPFCAVSGHIWETHGSAGATVGVGYGTAPAVGIQNSRETQGQKAKHANDSARMHAWPPPCRPNAPPQPCTRRRAHACTVSTGRSSNDALALLLARLHLHRLRTPGWMDEPSAQPTGRPGHSRAP